MDQQIKKCILALNHLVLHKPTVVSLTHRKSLQRSDKCLFFLFFFWSYWSVTQQRSYSAGAVCLITRRRTKKKPWAYDWENENCLICVNECMQVGDGTAKITGIGVNMSIPNNSMWKCSIWHLASSCNVVTCSTFFLVFTSEQDWGSLRAMLSGSDMLKDANSDLLVAIHGRSVDQCH